MNLAIVYRDLRTLRPNPRNARLHSDAQIEKLQGILAKFGWGNNAIGIADGEILAGHGRTVAALRMAEAGMPIPRNGDPWSGPTVDLSHLSKEERRAFVIADNRSSLDATWDTDMLRLELGELAAADFDLSATAFDLGELDHIFATPRGRGEQDDDIPAAPAKTVSRPGDIWILGDHRLGCSDSTSEDAMRALVGDTEANLCLTSPPYAQQRQYGGQVIADWDAMMIGVFSNLRMTDDAQVLVNLGLVHHDNEWHPYWNGWVEQMRIGGWRRFGLYCWDQGGGLPGDWLGRLAPSFEMVFHFNRNRARVRKTVISKNPGMIGGQLRESKGRMRQKVATAVGTTKKLDSVIRVHRHQGAIGKGVAHPAVFPIGFPLEIIPAFTDPGGVVIDPFAGSGTTIMAAEQLGRRCFAMEMVPAYTDVAVIRWERMVGRAAVRESDGMQFRKALAEA